MGTTNYSDLAADTLAVAGLGSFGSQTVTGPIKRTQQVVAAAGATQGGAGVISGTAGSVVIVTVTASTEGVKLPTAATGLEYRIHVPGTVGVKVYPFAGDRLDASSTNTAVLLVAGKTTVYYARDADRWVTLKGA